MARPRPWLALVLAALTSAATPAPSLRELVERHDLDGLRQRGPSAMKELVQLYEASDAAGRARVARVFYGLGWKSADAKRVLMADVRTSDRDLRLQAQWALGRVSDDPDVVDVLVENMRRDGNALFRDKAGCALAYDQIHLNGRQKLRLFEGVVAALEDESPDVRRIATLVLQIHTKTDRGFQPLAPPEQRAAALETWKQWLAEYRAQY